MISILARFFIKQTDATNDMVLRHAYGVLCGALGIALNTILCLIKLLAASLTGSVSIVADAMNNLADAGSSIVTLIGFKLANQKPDPHHPFGHGRMEYLSAFIVSIMILLMGFELGKTSVQKIGEGSDTHFSTISIVILFVSIGIKGYMFIYNTRLGKRFHSSAMKATGVDCLCDCVSTSVVLLCTIVSHVMSWDLDAWCGLAVAVFILWSGIRTAKETIDPLLGSPPAPEFVDQIKTIVLSYPEICGIHDLLVHNYGPGRLMISLHVEVPQTVDILTIHDRIDNIEQTLSNELSCNAVIHMDPIATNDALTISTREKVAVLAKTIHPEITIHDFRMVVGVTHTNLIFDMVVPYDLQRSDEDIKKDMDRLVKVLDCHYATVIQIDKPI